MMKTNRSPTYDEAMRLLGGIMENYTWDEFRPILRDPARLAKWIDEKMEWESVTQMHPDDPCVGELVARAANAEQSAMEFWGEITEKDRERIKDVFREKWGREGVATLAEGLT